MNLKRGIALSMLAIAVTYTLYGCGDKKEGGEADKATQVAAKVGSDEITVHQINHELTKLGNVAPERAKQAANQVLKGLVDQQLLMQKSIEQKLDRDPKVLQTLEATRRQILAQAYVQRLTENAAKPSDAEVVEYFDKHPELFSERRIYRLQELSVQPKPEAVDAVKAKLASARNLGEFVQWLQSEQIPVRGTQSVKAAEQLPLEVLPRLHALKDGQALTLNAGSQLNILYLADSQTQPMAKEQAKAVIERYLVNAKKREIAEAELKKLRDATKIEYLGDYKQAEQAEAAATPELAPAPAAEAAPGAAPATDPAAIDQGAMQKGLEGLK